MGRCPGSKNATRVPPRLCNATQAYDRPDSTQEHTECAERVSVARGLVNSSGQAQYGHDTTIGGRCMRPTEVGELGSTLALEIPVGALVANGITKQMP
jgi:hypothetical protein